MKLWQKTSLICVVVLVLVVSSCSIFLLYNSQKQILDLTIEQAKAENIDLLTSTTKMVDYYLDSNTSDTIKQSTIKYCFTQFAKDSSVLMFEDNILYSNVIINPSEYLSLNKEYESNVYDNEINGRNILIIGENQIIAGEYYSFYTIKDISNVYNSIYQMAWFIITVSVISLIIGTIAIIFLIKKTVKPIADLAKTSRKISDGNYSIRAEVNSNDELSDLAKDFNIMANSVETHISALTETSERQNLFISGVSHEFKTPLTVMLLHSKLLRHANMTAEEKDKSLEYIENQCNWLNNMVQTMLKLLSLDKEVKKETFDTNKLFSNINDIMCEILNSRNTKLIVSVNTKNIHANFNLMEILLINLIDNASKSYNEKDYDKNIYLSTYDNIIEVRDEGRGIDEISLNRIFDPFFMVDKSRSKKSGGTGLGLALVKKIAELHNATIDVKSEVGVGTSIKIHL